MKKVVFALSLCAASMLFASQDNYKYEFTPIIGGSFSEGNLGYKQRLVIGASVARNFENSWINQVELGVNFTPKQTFSWTKDSTSVARYYLNGIANLINFSKNTKLYGLLGVGYEDWTNELKENPATKGNNYAKDGWFGEYGVGLKHYWTDNFATKLEVKDLVRLKHASNTLIYSLGFSADFGSRDAMPMVASDVPVKSSSELIGDSDGDGVPDNLDKCPGTPAHVVVDDNGCEKIIRLELGVNFKVNSAEVNEKYKSEIEKVADFIKDHKNYTIVLDGYTDNTGSAKYNLKLSKRRADSVKNILVGMGVNANRILTFGYGESNPIATNTTAVGRAENRRVDAKFRK